MSTGWAAVVGPGAVGSLIAGSIERAGTPVARAARGRPPLPRRPGCRAVFLCVKAAGLRWAVSSARRAAGPRTAVVGLMNGVGHERALRAAFGASRVVLGSCYFAALRAGRSVRHMGGRRIHLASAPEGRAARAEAARLLRAAGWDVKVVRSPERMLWTKLVFNAAINPLGALLAVPNGQLARDGGLRALLARLSREGARAARAAGRAPLYPDMASRTAAACEAVPAQINSMAQDLAAGRPTEAPAILAPLVSAARRTRTPAPTLEKVSRLLSRLERELRGHGR